MYTISQALLDGLKALYYGETLFHEDFPAYCAREFSSRTYKPGYRTRAMMHAFALRIAIALIVESEESVKETNAVQDSDEIITLCHQTAVKTLDSKPADAETFCRTFIRNWCEQFTAD